MRPTAAACCLFLAAVSSCRTPGEPPAPDAAPSDSAVFAGTARVADAVALFDGKDISGWESYLDRPGVAKGDVWSVRDGVIACTGDPLGYLYTRESYTDFRLVAEYRWPGTPGNSGLFIRINGQPRGLPRCIETQLKSGEAGDVFAFHGMAIGGDPGRLFTKEEPLFGKLTGVRRIEGNEGAPGEWNRVEVIAVGPRIEVIVNGKKVNEITGAEVVAGPVGLQSEGGEIHFRKVAITPLP